jgi:ThiF family
MTGGADEADVCRAQLFDERRPEDQAALARLRADTTITVLDHSDSQRTELSRVLSAPTAGILDEPARWAYYPWRRTVISVLGPNAFRLVRLDRNRNKITRSEQDRYARLTIGIVGLSVGHAIAHTLALEGLCGEIRLADHDTIELSNLNRIPATVFDLGLNKSVVAARRIAELDPYLPVTTLPGGLTSAAMARFLDGLDLVVEECDSLDMKLAIREAARARGIAVLMETGDRGLLDVERFDLEPARPLFHGLLGDLAADGLAGLPTRDKVPYVLRIVEASSMSARMAASMVEVDETITTWPQLGGEVALGGAIVAAAVRRLGRDDDLPSGRVRIDVDAHLDELGVVAEPDDGAGAAATADGDDLRAPEDAIAAVVHAVRLAPSGGNAQPWSVSADSRSLRIYLAAERSSAMDVRYRGSYVAIGAALHNARVAAAANAILGPVEIRAAGPDSDLVATLHFGSEDDPELSAQYGSMLRRGSNRHFGTAAPLDPRTRDALTATARRTGARLHLLSDRASIAACADILAVSDRVRYLTPVLHDQLISELRWPGSDRLDVGIDVRTLELDATDLAKLDVVRRPDVMAYLAQWGGGRALGDATRDLVKSSSALAVVTVGGTNPTDFIRGGSAVEDVWICAEQHGLAVQPVSPVFLFAGDSADMEALSASFASDLAELQRAFAEIAGVQPGEAVALVLRLSHAPAATTRSQRLSLDAISHPPAPGVTAAPR